MPKTEFALLLAALGLAGALALDTSSKKSAAYDEPKHLATGAAMLHGGKFYGDDNTPLSALYALPLLARDVDSSSLPTARTGKGIFEAGASYLAENGVLATLRPARAVSTAMFLLLLALLAVLARRQGGPMGAALAVALLAFDPTFLGHASIVSADLPLAAAALAAVLAWNRFAAAPQIRTAVPLALALAFALLAKLNGVFVPVVLGFEALLRCRELGGGRRLALFAGAAAAGAVIVVLAYPGEPLAHVRALAHVAGYGGGTLPQYFDGALGSRSPWFYPAVLLFKLPPATLLALLAFAAALPALRRRRLLPQRPVVLLAAVFLLAPIASGYHQGVRFLLPFHPLAALMLAPLGALAAAAGRPARAALAAVALAQVCTALAQHPHHLAYWNPFAGGSDRGERWFVDSNGDWGQDLTTLQRFVQDQRVERLYLAAYSSVPPAAYGIAFENLFDGPAGLTLPRPGERALLAISDTVFRFVLAGREQRKDPLLPIVGPLADCPPDVHLGFTIRLWWVTPEVLARLKVR